MVDQNSQFYAILTKVGAAKQANADALGIPWKITHMAVGDANLTDPMPDASWTSLINEWRRAPLNQLKVDDKDSAIIIAEQVIPAEVGGRWIREVALFDEDGAMVAVANCAPTYKPLLSQGSGRTQVVRMNLVVSSSSNVQLKIDPSVVLATREFVTEELAKQDFKHSVLVATTGPIVLSGLQTIDAVALPAGAAVLVKDQVAAKDNGLYVVAAGAWTRRADADTSTKVTPGLLVHVEKGAINGDGVWQLVTDGPINLGVSALAFEMAFGRTGVAAGTYRSVTVDKYGRVVGATNPTTVAGYGLTDVYTMTQIDQALALKAPLASPDFSGIPKAPTAAPGTNSLQLATTAFVAALGALKANVASPALTGTPTAPTAAPGTNTLQLATTAFVQAAVAALVGSAPEALNAINELAAAIGNDPNFATTMLNLLAGKADKATTLDGYGIIDALKIGTVGLAAKTAPLLSDFKAVNPGGLYQAYGATYAAATPNAPTGSQGNVLGVIAVTPRADATYYLVFENAGNSLNRRFWVGQYNSGTDTLFWSGLMTTDKIATQEQVNAGADDTTIVTPKKLRSGVSYLAAENGYVALPSWLGGLIIQWGKATITTNSTGGVATVSLPYSYPNNHFGATGNYRKNVIISDSFPVSTYPTSLSTLTLVLDAATGGSTPTGAQEAFYISVGN